jgi:hypothetical protein
LSQAASDLELESADAVNEGSLHFLAAPPAKPVHLTRIASASIPAPGSRRNATII